MKIYFKSSACNRISWSDGSVSLGTRVCVCVSYKTEMFNWVRGSCFNPALMSQWTVWKAMEGFDPVRHTHARTRMHAHTRTHTHTKKYTHAAQQRTDKSHTKLQLKMMNKSGWELLLWWLIIRNNSTRCPVSGEQLMTLCVCVWLRASIGESTCYLHFKLQWLHVPVRSALQQLQPSRHHLNTWLNNRRCS